MVLLRVSCNVRLLVLSEPVAEFCLTIKLPNIVAEPVNGNAGAYEALSAWVAYEAVPCNEPVNPAVAITLPVTCTCEPEAKIRFDLAPIPVPLPTIKADSAEDERLYAPCTCW